MDKVKEILKQIIVFIFFVMFTIYLGIQDSMLLEKYGPDIMIHDTYDENPQE